MSGQASQTDKPTFQSLDYYPHSFITITN